MIEERFCKAYIIDGAPGGKSAYIPMLLILVYGTFRMYHQESGGIGNRPEFSVEHLLGGIAAKTVES
jgi:hypothetical protein